MGENLTKSQYPIAHYSIIISNVLHGFIIKPRSNSWGIDSQIPLSAPATETVLAGFVILNSQ